MNIAVYAKPMERRRNTINAKLVNNGKYSFKWPSTPSYMSQKRFENNLLVIVKVKLQ